MNLKIYIGGEFKESKQVLEVTNPYNNSVIAKTYLAGKEELEFALKKGQEIKDEVRFLPAFKKYEALQYIANKLNERKEEFANYLVQEAGKPLKYALGEVERAIQVFIIASEECKRIPAEHFSVDWTKAGENKEGIINYFPLGIIAGIAPFNFPLNLAVHKIAPAIASGNVILLKPARSTPISVLKLAEIIHETDLPKGMVSVLPMDREAGNQLVTDERINMLSFTGSPEVGWKMKSEAGKKKIALELGGNAGLIITESSDLDIAVNKALIGSFAYSGQVCIHTQRIYVHQSIIEEFSEKLSKKTKSLVYGDPSNIETDISVMIDEENAVRVENWITEAKQGGAELISGGNRKDNFIEPTILTNTNSDMKVCACEIFGPVVILEPYDKFELAVDMVNNSEFGLQAGVFTNKISEMNYAFQHIEAGGVIINDVPTFRVDHMPYGGIKNSGFGREGIKFTIHEMMEPKLMIKNRL